MPFSPSTCQRAVCKLPPLQEEGDGAIVVRHLSSSPDLLSSVHLQKRKENGNG